MIFLFPVHISIYSVVNNLLTKTTKFWQFRFEQNPLFFCTQISTMSQLTAMRSRVGHNGFPAPPTSGLSAKDNYNQQHEITTSSDEFNPRQIANHDHQFVRSPPGLLNEYSHLGVGTTRMDDVGSNRIYEEVHLNDGKTKPKKQNKLEVYCKM